MREMSHDQLLFGPMLLGVCFNAILYGVFIMQALTYNVMYKRDRRWFRPLVLYLFVMETLNTVLSIALIYEPLIIHYGSNHSKIFSPMMLPAEPIVTVAVSTPVQLFFAWRIKSISHSKIIPSLIGIFAFCSLTGGLATTIAVSMLPQYSQFPRFHAAPITWLASSAAADVGITIALVWILYVRKTGMSTTDTLLTKITILTVQMGLITAISACLDIILFLALPSTTLYFIWDFTLSKLYANSLMSALNARIAWNNDLDARRNTNDVVLFMEEEESPRSRSSKFIPQSIEMMTI